MSDKSAYPKAGLPTAGDLAEPVARAVREEVRRELRERSGRRAFRLYGGAAAAALYAGGALTACLVLLFAIALPAWLAALIVFVLLLGVAAWLKTSAARGRGPVRLLGRPRRRRLPPLRGPPILPGPPRLRRLRGPGRLRGPVRLRRVGRLRGLGRLPSPHSPPILISLLILLRRGDRPWRRIRCWPGIARPWTSSPNGCTRSGPISGTTRRPAPSGPCATW
ncbi:phage holin family protein [Streptomyces malaysiensis subsp. malaysiensis]